MSDNKNNTGKQDDIRVDKNDPNEVSYLQREFPSKSKEQIMDAIERFGPMRENIVKNLR